MDMNYFREIYISDRPELPDMGLLFETSPIEHKKLMEQSGRMSSVLFRTRPLYDELETRLRAERRTVGNPPIVGLTIQLWRKPSSRPIYEMTHAGTSVVQIEIPYDPYDLLDIPLQNAVLGELFINFVEQALDRLVDYPELPFETIRTSLQRFRANNYTYNFKLGERMLPGTKVKGRIDVALACDGLHRELTLSYRGKELLKRSLIGEVEIPVHFYRFFSRFHMDGHILTVDPASPTGEHTHIDLRAFPEVMEYVEKTRTT